MTLAIFDFDGTITAKDSLFHFTMFAKGKFKYYLGLIYIAPFLFLYKLKLLAAHKTKERFIAIFFKNTTETVFNEMCDRYVKEKIDSIILLSALEKIRWHQKNGHRVIVVSASPEDYLIKWCSNMNIECIATKLQKKNNVITGKIEGYNCNGEEKVARLLQSVNLTDYKEIYGYGNSAGDKKMLELCHYKFYRIFR